MATSRKPHPHFLLQVQPEAGQACLRRAVDADAAPLPAAALQQEEKKEK